MKITDISMTGPMILATLDGLKLQTRRCLNIQPLDVLTKRPPWHNTVTRTFGGKKCWFALMKRNPNRGTIFNCRYGEVGDRLRVLESFQVIEPRPNMKVLVRYLADKSERVVKLTDDEWAKWVQRTYRFRATPGRFMYRSLSRIMLEIVSVRVERLDAISKTDIIKEGVCIDRSSDPIVTFRSLWEMIHPKKECSWLANPWVWVLEFRLTKP